MEPLKISKREQGLLFIILALIVGFLFYQYFFVPQKAELDRMKADWETKEYQKVSQMHRIHARGDLELKLKELKESMQPVVDRYYTEVDQEEFIVLLNQFAEKSKLTLKKLDFAEEDATLEMPAPVQTQPGTETSADGAAPTEGEKDSTEETPSSAPSPEGETAENPLANIKLLSAKAEFEGDYGQFRSLLANMDDNPKRVISASLDLKKDDDVLKTATSTVTGNIILDFYQIKDIAKYSTEEEESVLAGPAVPKSSKPDPVIGYPWAFKVVSSVGVGTVPRPSPLSPNPNSPVKPSIQTKDGMVTYFPSITNSIPPVATGLVRDSGPVVSLMPSRTNAVLTSTETSGETAAFNYDVFELFRFENLKMIDEGALTPQGSATAAFVNLSEKDHKVLSLSYQLDPVYGVPLALSFADEKIEIKNKPDYFALSAYAYEESDHSVLLSVIDSKGQQYTIPFCEKIDWSEWKTLSAFDIPEMQYPISVKGISIIGRQNSPKISSMLLFDSISTGYRVP